MIFEFFTWWYGRGYSEIIHYCLGLIQKVQRSFSIPSLLDTLFSPWRQIIALPGRSLDEKMRAMLDNVVSRCVGLIVRLIVLFTAFILTILTSVLSAVLAVSWPLVPVLIIFCLIKAVI
jgi:hypothetical protein